jgi:hypothetical protein
LVKAIAIPSQIISFFCLFPVQRRNWAMQQRKSEMSEQKNGLPAVLQ